MRLAHWHLHLLGLVHETAKLFSDHTAYLVLLLAIPETASPVTSARQANIAKLGIPPLRHVPVVHMDQVKVK